MGDFNELMSDVMPGMVPSHDRPSVPEADLSAHLEKLRPILPPDATDSRVLEVLGKQSVFAEEVLGQVMELLGMQPFFANLRYRYLEVCTETELLDVDIKMVAHMKFKTDAMTG